MVEPIHVPDAAEQPAAYRSALLGTLGDRDPLDVYAATAAAVGDLCAALSGGQWFTPLTPGEWNAHQLVGHLFDVDVVFGFRWRLLLTQVQPSYPTIDPEVWSELPHPPPLDLLAAFTGLRHANAALLASLTPDDLARTGAQDVGAESILTMVHTLAGHDLAHLNQLRRTVDVARG